MGERWLHRRGKQVDGRVVKVRSGLEVVQRMHKATGGLIRAEFFVDEGQIKEISISGDFFCFPKDAVNRLEMMLEGKPVRQLQAVISEFYEKDDFELPGVGIDDWMDLFKI